MELVSGTSETLFQHVVTVIIKEHFSKSFSQTTIKETDIIEFKGRASFVEESVVCILVCEQVHLG